ncbi:MAG: PorV/PorQ family protein [Candidatus Firestonebacteria bacterium]|nr:PorV/PorQ family protein [Candidatus Firestonebacteria bacterium]
MKIIQLAIILMFAMFGPAKTADLENSGTAAVILKFNGGIRGGGMADACAGVYGGIDSVYGNPAGLITEKPAIVARYNNLFGEVNVGSFSYINSFKFGSLGASFLYLNYGSIDITDESGITTGKFFPSDLLAIISYSKKLTPELSVGVNIKGFQEYIDNYNFGAVVFDAGGILEIIGDELSVGFLIKNIGLETNTFKIPLNIKAGVVYNFYGIVSDSASKSIIFKKSPPRNAISQTEDHLTVAVDLDLSSDEGAGINLGVEYWYRDIAGRMGYKFRSEARYAGGLTIGFGLKLYGYDINYSLTPYGALGLGHNFSFSFNL